MGNRRAAQIAQLPQTAFEALQTPYAFIGLGRTNNYVENLLVGSTLKNDDQEFFNNFEGIIPNAQVIITPSTKERKSWHIELYLHPGEWIPFVSLVVAITACILATTVFILHLHEKKEDEIERRKESHHINFQAL